MSLLMSTGDTYQRGSDRQHARAGGCRHGGCVRQHAGRDRTDNAPNIEHRRYVRRQLGAHGSYKNNEQNSNSCFIHGSGALTRVLNVEWQPEKECVADELGEEQAERELDHAGNAQRAEKSDRIVLRWRSVNAAEDGRSFVDFLRRRLKDGI